MFRSIGCCFYFVAVPFALVLGAAFLRFSVSLANRLIGATSYEPGREEDEPDEWIGYRQTKRAMTVIGIPELTIGKGMVCLLLMMVVNLLACLLFLIILWAAGIVDELDHGTSGQPLFAYQLMSMFLSFPLTAWLLSRLTLTSFGRGCLVLIIYYILLFMVFAALFVFMSLLRLR
jgi:hypothetical protein